MGLYRDIKYYPDTLESKQLMKVYLDFVYNVIDDEFPNMERMKLSRLTPESFSKVFDKMEDAITDADVVMMLRIQLERQKQNIFPSLREYSQRYCLNRNNIKLAKKDVIVMHPGPINRGVELSPDIADDPSFSVILDQVNKGVAVRMALLYLLTGGSE